MHEGIDKVQLGSEKLPSLKEFSEGTFLLKVLSIKKLTSQNHGTGVIGEFEVLDSQDTSHPAGTKASYMLFEKYNQFDLYWKNLAYFVRGVIGTKPSSTDLSSLLDESNPAADKKVQVQISKSDNGKYNKFNWVYVPE